MRVVRTLALAMSFCVCSIPALSPARAQVVVGISVTIAPPPLPIYAQPPIPAAGYLWVPGYWGWSPDIGYYWVPGTWILPPQLGLLWTPGYWAWSDGIYVFHAGYWGPQIGFYGGVVYGFGYTGVGYAGGYWRGGLFFYNRSVNNITNVSITNVYNKTVVVNNTTNVSYNGGAGGTTAKPTPQQLAAAREPHVATTPEQTRHIEAAARDPSLSFSHNHGHPSVAATAHPAVFKGPGIVAAHAGKPIAVPPPNGPLGLRHTNIPGNKAPAGTTTTNGRGNKPGNSVETNIHEHKGNGAGTNPIRGSGPATAMKQLPPKGAKPTPQIAKPVPAPHVVEHPAFNAPKPPPRRPPSPPPQHPTLPAKPNCPPSQHCR